MAKGLFFLPLYHPVIFSPAGETQTHPGVGVRDGLFRSCLTTEHHQPPGEACKKK